MKLLLCMSTIGVVIVTGADELVAQKIDAVCFSANVKKLHR